MKVGDLCFEGEVVEVVVAPGLVALLLLVAVVAAVSCIVENSYHTRTTRYRFWATTTQSDT